MSMQELNVSVMGKFLHLMIIYPKALVYFELSLSLNLLHMFILCPVIAYER